MTMKVIGSDLIHLVLLCYKNNELPVDQIQTIFLGIPFSLVYVSLQTRVPRGVARYAHYN